MAVEQSSLKAHGSLQAKVPFPTTLESEAKKLTPIGA
jgi:hypothetical protein